MKKEQLPMTLAKAREIALGSKTGCLGEPSKMPGYSFGISAEKCKRGAELASDLNTPCGHCYAMVAYYRYYHEVRVAHQRRYEALTNPDWVPAMIVLLAHHIKPDGGRSDRGKIISPHFRWFDSGDLQGSWMLANIVQVAIATPWIKHFLPTREYQMVLEYLQLVANGEAPAIPENLCVRLSADYIGKPPALPPGLERFPTSTVHRGHGHRNRIIVPGKRVSVHCTAYMRSMSADGSGQCGKCRACWDGRAENVSFTLHNERHANWSLPLPFAQPVVPNHPTAIVISWERGRSYPKKKRREMAKRQVHLPIFGGEKE